MVQGLLMELKDYNCWSIAEAAGHRGPHRLQHLLSRAVWDDQHLMDIAAAWAAGHLDDGDAVLIVDETADEKSSADCAGAARQLLRHRGRDRHHGLRMRLGRQRPPDRCKRRMNSHIVNCLEPQPGSLRKPQPARACLVGLGRSPVMYSEIVWSSGASAQVSRWMSGR
jgi:hypothetical protein